MQRFEGIIKVTRKLSFFAAVAAAVAAVVAVAAAVALDWIIFIQIVLVLHQFQDEKVFQLKKWELLK